MSTTAIGFVLALTFVVCAAVVLSTLSGIVRENEQGGTVAVASAPSWAPAPVHVHSRPAPGYVGRHRRE